MLSQLNTDTTDCRRNLSCVAGQHSLSSRRDNYTIPRKVKQSLYRCGQVLRFLGGRGSQTYRQSAHEGGKVVIV